MFGAMSLLHLVHDAALRNMQSALQPAVWIAIPAALLLQLRAAALHT
jgi:hypothetical protein